MSVEQRIMSAIVRTDMFLVSAWKYMLALLIMLGIGILVIIKTRWK